VTERDVGAAAAGAAERWIQRIMMTFIHHSAIENGSRAFPILHSQQAKMGPIKKIRIAYKAWRRKRQAQKQAQKRKEQVNKFRASLGLSEK
jgi:hypothetical protein